MYKIYINEIPVILVKSNDSQIFSGVAPSKLVIPFVGNPNIIHTVYRICDEPGLVELIVLYADNPRDILMAFRTQIKEIVAAGGLVYNEFNEVLFIYRRGFWDLPKGKIDPGETPEIAAVREVMEETGVKDVVLENQIGTTYHIFRTARNDNRFLKKTIWFRMKTHKQPIIIQREEDIEEATWRNIPEFLEKFKPVYNNIVDILKAD